MKDQEINSLRGIMEERPSKNSPSLPRVAVIVLGRLEDKETRTQNPVLGSSSHSRAAVANNTLSLSIDPFLFDLLDLSKDLFIDQINKNSSEDLKDQGRIFLTDLENSTKWNVKGSVSIDLPLLSSLDLSFAKKEAVTQKTKKTKTSYAKTLKENLNKTMNMNGMNVD